MRKVSVIFYFHPNGASYLIPTIMYTPASSFDHFILSFKFLNFTVSTIFRGI
jgi:hypothetical protein